jgi:putative DNA primase/helicase
MAKTPESSTRRKQAKAPRKGAAAPASLEAVVEADGNFIQFGQAEAGKRPAQNTLGFTEQPGRKAEAAPSATATDNSRRTLRVPDSVQERFIHIGNKFHFPDGTEAFTQQGNRLTTRSENAVVIQSMVAIAREQGAGPVTVGGTEFFRKEAWFAGNLAGLEVKGYEPTEFERERLARAIAARRSPAADGKSVASGERESPSSPSAERGVDRRQQGSDLIVGRLVDHGAAPYSHDPKQTLSYFVRIETERGDREIWGVDLERAFRHSLSTPGIGDVVGLRAIGKEAVTVLSTKTDAEGRQIGTEPLDTHRNQWIVERKSFLDERRQMAEVLRDTSLSATDAIRRHPELEGSYLQLQMGGALADDRFRSKEQREQFVEHLRAHLAQRIEFGQPLEPVHLRAAEERSVQPRSQDRDYHPTR